MNAVQIALDLIARGIAPVPIPIGDKNPNRKQWQLLRITPAEVPEYFAGRVNVGAIMGPASNGLTDVDLDCKEAVALAPYFLPETHSIYGRASKQRSHYLYTCGDPDQKAVIKLLDEAKACIVELRLGGGGKGSQSVMPGSVHTSGEHYEWDEDGERGTVAFATLKAAAVKIAVGTMLIRHWPAVGSRHDAALTLGGFLARVGWDADAIEYFVATLAHVHGESDDPDAHGKTARDGAERHADGGQVYGLPQMMEIFGELVMKPIAKLLNYRSVGEITAQDGDAKIAELNKTYALVLAGNKAAVMKFESVTKFRLLQISAFKQWFSNQLIAVGEKFVAVGDYWLRHRERRQYEGIEFDPRGVRPGFYNLWQGFAVKPKEGDCSKFLAHLKDNVACGDEKTYALLEQQIESMTTEQAWWFDTLMRGMLPGQVPGEVVGTCTKDAVYKCYIEHAKIQGANHRSIETAIGSFLTKQLGTALKTKRPEMGSMRPYFYVMPPLKACRELFANKVGQEIKWGEKWEKELWAHDREWF